MPNVLPLSSWLPLESLIQRPSCAALFLSGIFLISIIEDAITSSATDLVFEYGALKTVMPFLVAEAISTWLVPIQKQPIACSFVALFNTSSVIFDFDLIPNR